MILLFLKFLFVQISRFCFLVSFWKLAHYVIQSMTTTLHVKIALQKNYAVFFVRTITPGRGCGVHWLKRLHTTTQLLLLFHSTAVHLKTLLNGLSQCQRPLLATQARDSRSWPGGEALVPWLAAAARWH